MTKRRKWTCSILFWNPNWLDYFECRRFFLFYSPWWFCGCQTLKRFLLFVPASTMLLFTLRKTLEKKIVCHQSLQYGHTVPFHEIIVRNNDKYNYTIFCTSTLLVWCHSNIRTEWVEFDFNYDLSWYPTFFTLIEPMYHTYVQIPIILSRIQSK